MSFTIITNDATATLNIYGWQGTPQRPRVDGVPFRRMGANGSEVNTFGTVAPQSESTGYALCTTDSAAQSAKVFLEGLDKKYFAIVLSTSEAFNSCLCLNVSVHLRHRKLTYNGVSYPYQVEIRLSYEVQP